MTWTDALWSLFTIAASTGGSWLIARRTVKAERASSAHTAAVDQLVPSLASLRTLLHGPSNMVQPADVSAAMSEFETLSMQHDVALPRGLRSLRREIRAAVGNYFGGASLSAIDIRMNDYPLSEPDPYWQEISRSYMEYAMAQLRLSLVQPGQRAELTPFHQWRREEDEEYRAQKPLPANPAGRHARESCSCEGQPAMRSIHDEQPVPSGFKDQVGLPDWTPDERSARIVTTGTRGRDHRS
jgi:hypothetical protein